MEVFFVIVGDCPVAKGIEDACLPIISGTGYSELPGTMDLVAYNKHFGMAV